MSHTCAGTFCVSVNARVCVCVCEGMGVDACVGISAVCTVSFVRVT